MPQAFAPDLLAGKRVLVVGGARGIGRAIAAGCARAGAAVTLTAREDGHAAGAAAELGAESGARVAGGRFDAAAGDAEGALDALLDAHGPFDALCYNAGTSPRYTRADKLDTATWQQLLAVNLTGPFIAARAFAARAIADRRPGAIVFTGSVASLAGAQRLAAYAATKHGVLGLARSLALDWAEHGIRVNVLVPGWVATDFTAGLRENPALKARLEAQVPLRRFATPDEVAPPAVFLLSDAARYVNGAAWTVDGGLLAG
jgi:NAD(P)-dependent dehydrogenase (short-subunit alcohol dehydrogenase family)